MRLLKNNFGSSIMLTLVLLGLVLSGITTTMILSNAYLSQAQNDKDEAERTQVFSTMKSLLDDQRFCNALFKDGYNTEAGIYKINSDSFVDATGNKDLAQAVADHEKAFDIYRVTSIQLSNLKTPAASLVAKPGDSNLIQYKQFDLAMTIEQKQPSLLRHFTTVLGKSSNNFTTKDGDLEVIFTSNNRCFTHSNQADTGSAAAAVYATSVALSCKALGGQYLFGRCQMKEYALNSAGLADTTTSITNQSAFTDALCAIELKALQNLGPHFIKASGTPNMAYGWTSLCQKPKWAGCRYNANDDVLTQMVKGGNPEGTITPYPGQNAADWQMWSGSFGVKSVGSEMNTVVTPTYQRRLNRVAAAYTYSGIGSKGAPVFTTTPTSFGQIMTGLLKNPIGLGAGDPLMSTIISLFAPACNKARFQVSYNCTEGWAEVDQVLIQTQKLHIGMFGFSCRWRNAGTYVVPTESQLMAAVKSKGYPVNSFTPVPGATNDVADIAQMQSKLAAVKTMADLMALLSGDGTVDTASGETETPGVPAQLVAALTAAEQTAWSNFSATTTAQLTLLVTPPLAQTANQTVAQYTAYLNQYYATAQANFSTLDTTLTSYKAFSASFTNPDGTTRDLTAQPVYNNTIKPLVVAINAAQSTLIAAAASQNVAITLTPIALP